MSGKFAAKICRKSKTFILLYNVLVKSTLWVKKLDLFSFEHNWQILSDFNNSFAVADRN